MSPTISQLLGYDWSIPDGCGAAFDELSTVVDDRHDDLAGVLRELESVWEAGVAREAALGHGTGLRRELAAAQPALTAVAQALREFAAGVPAIAAHLRAVIDEARSHGLAVTDDGTVAAVGHDPYAVSGSYRPADPSSYAAQIRELLDRASALDQATVAALTANRPPTGAAGPQQGAVPRERIPARGTDPAQVHRWWDALTEEQRRYVVATYPAMIGALDGVPVASRDQANRIVLDDERDRLTDELRTVRERQADLKRQIEHGTANPAELWECWRIRDDDEELAAKLRGVDQIADRLESTDPGKERAYLIGFSVQGDGRAIVAVGNPDTARNVLTYVPGTGADVTHTGGDIRRADLMAQDANTLDPTAGTAAIMWLGYDAPDTIPAASLHKYADGAANDLNQFQSGLRATHEGAVASHNVVLGHSYGTTAIGHTAEQRGIDADDLVFVASPGVGTDDVADLHGVAPGHVWATRATGDPIHWVPDLDIAHGNDPVRADFGARVFSSDAGDHSSYWSKGNSARTNIARIVTGRGAVN